MAASEWLVHGCGDRNDQGQRDSDLLAISHHRWYVYELIDQHALMSNLINENEDELCEYFMKPGWCVDPRRNDTS